MSVSMQVGGHPVGLGQTMRRDKWWIEPLWTGGGFLLFVLYTTWALFQGEHYYYHGYLSPFYSPLLFTDTTAPGSAPVEHAWFGAWPEWWPTWWPSFIPRSPAMLILVFPLAFRMTCYYYRKFYYRAFFATPPGCAVGPFPQKGYKGETGLLIIQNVHRYALYIALSYIAILGYDGYMSLFRDGKFGIGVGSVILILNAIGLGTYTLGCHAFRHLVGGGADCFSCPNGKEHMRIKLWNPVTWLNQRHMLFAWVSMIWVMLTDVYVRLVSMGIIHDYSTWD